MKLRFLWTVLAVLALAAPARAELQIGRFGGNARSDADSFSGDDS